MCMCKKCTKICGGLFVALGALFLLRDLNVWDFWGISWYTALFVVIGLAGFGASSCPDCEMARTGKGKK